MIEKVVIQQVGVKPVSVRNIAQPAGVLWTPNHNRINSYIDLGEWINAGDFSIECTPREIVGSARQYLLGTVFDNRRYVRTEGSTVVIGLGDTPDIKTGLAAVLHQPIKLTVMRDENKWVVEHAGKTATGSYGGDATAKLYISSPVDDRLNGQVTDVRLTDHVNTSNSRFYSCTLRSIDMPTTTIVKNILDPSGATDGQMINFGDEQPWVELKQ